MTEGLTTIKLPSGSTAEIVEFFTRGDAKYIDKYRWGGAEVKQQESGEIEIINIPVTQQEMESDAIVLRGTKTIDGREFTEAELEKIGELDFKLLLKTLKELRAGIKKKK